MIKVKLDDIANSVNGKIINYSNISVENVSINSKENLKNGIFVPLKGENVDGHDFIKDAYENGAITCFSEKELNISEPYILVESTRQALKDFAEYYISLFKIPIVAITGSSGKTTTKDIVACVLSQKYKVVKTIGNFNNEVGLPLTIFNIDDTTDITILEMGTSSFGEISNLSKIAKPDICVITNIGTAHIETLCDAEGILKAKSEIFDYMKPNGIAVLNYDDKMLRSLSNKIDNIFFYSLENKSSDSDKFFYADNIKYNDIYSVSFDAINNSEKINVNVPATGKYMVYNALVSIIIGKYFNMSKNDIIDGILNFKPSKNRFDIIKTDKYTIINSVYNANPDSMKAIIDVLCYTSKRKICILGDMLELGNHAEEFHLDIGKYAIIKNIDVLVCIGVLSYKIYEGALLQQNSYKSNSEVFYFRTKEEFLDSASNILRCNDVVLVKASRSMKFEYIVENLMR